MSILSKANTAMPQPTSSPQRDAQAREILRRNDLGGYTVPTDGLYPFQWNWDSAFVALGFATFDEDRAWREIETLFLGQWDNGMVPHIVFHRDDPRYFPGPERWGSGHTPPTSGYTQPPVVATIMRRLVDSARDVDAARARAQGLLTKVYHWHRWFMAARLDAATQTIAVAHPWESGRDNQPCWDAAMARVDTGGVEPYQRRDLQHVDADQRPTAVEYDRYMALVQLGRDCGWDADTLRNTSPFWVADPGMTAILARAQGDLATLAEDLGAPAIARQAREWHDRLVAGMAMLWNDDLGAYVTRDLRSGALYDGVMSVSFLGFLAGAATGPKATRLLAHFDRIAQACRYTVPSFDPAHPAFDAVRYWRGPAWLMINWLIATGLAEAGYHDRARRVRSDSRALVEHAGFYEYFDPRDGSGCGGDQFSWTAAMWLAWAGSEGRN